MFGCFPFSRGEQLGEALKQRGRWPAWSPEPFGLEWRFELLFCGVPGVLPTMPTAPGMASSWDRSLNLVTSAPPE